MAQFWYVLAMLLALVVIVIVIFPVYLEKLTLKLGIQAIIPKYLLYGLHDVLLGVAASAILWLILQE